ncbi:MAG: hypothetical protein MO852_01715 [Candidatus Devosia euplotis]|nr:hypothetical protein [Candidatus Devosia euplotis]
MPAEDVLALADCTSNPSGTFIIAAPQLPRIANFDDLDPLRAEPGVNLVLAALGQSIPREADLIIPPGSKATRSDLAALRANGWDIDIIAHHRAGARSSAFAVGIRCCAIPSPTLTASKARPA